MSQVRIESEGGRGFKVTDSETGDPLPMVQRVEIELDARTSMPKAKVFTLMPRVDIKLPANNVEQVAVCPYCGHTKPVGP
jgi:hypothetical protein